MVKPILIVGAIINHDIKKSNSFMCLRNYHNVFYDVLSEITIDYAEIWCILFT